MIEYRTSEAIRGAAALCDRKLEKIGADCRQQHVLECLRRGVREPIRCITAQSRESDGYRNEGRDSL